MTGSRPYGSYLGGITSPSCAFYGQVVKLLAVFRSVLRLDTNSIVDRASQALSATEIDFGRLNGDVPEEKLGLFEFTAGQMAKACTRATKIVRCQFLDSRALAQSFTTCQTTLSDIPSPQVLPARQTHRKKRPSVIPAQSSHESIAALTRLSHLEGIRAHKSNGMSKGDTKVSTTKAELISLRTGEEQRWGVRR